MQVYEKKGNIIVLRNPFILENMDQITLDAMIQSEFDKLVQKYFDKSLISRRGSWGPNYDADLTNENKYFKKSGYDYCGELKFIHFTTLPKLFSILNERIIRLYNLHSSNDENEYKYAAEILGLSNEEINFRKKYIYTFSFCPFSELSNIFLWEKYGNNYAGVVINFSIRNNPAKWKNYHISEIKYKLNENFEKYVSEKNSLENKYNVNLKLDLSKLIAFHKIVEWDKEREVRLLTYNPYTKFNEYLKFSKVEYKIADNRNRFIEYIELPLKVNNSSPFVQNDDPILDRRQNLDYSFFTTRPEIIIENIYFGNKMGINFVELSKLIQKIEEIIRLNFGYKIKIDKNFIE